MPDRELHRFAFRLGCFVLPYAVVVLTIELFFTFTSETVSAKEWVRRHAHLDDPPLLQRRWFSQQNYLCHLGLIAMKKPGILAVGSSRCGDFSARMFRPLNDEFYTADGLIYRMEDLRTFTAMVVDEELPCPEVLILGLDHWLLSPRQGRSAWLESGPKDDVLKPGSHLAVICRMLRKTVRGENVFRQYGSNARNSPAGDADVSEPLIEYDAPQFVDRENPPVIERVFSGGNRFEFISDLDGDKITELCVLLAQLRDEGAQIAVFLPPFSTETYDAVSKSDQHRQWWHTYSITLPRILRDQGLVCIGPSKPGTYGLSDRGNMRDGFHCGPYMMSFILEELVLTAPPGSYLRRIDLDHLNSLRRAPSVTVPPTDPTSTRG